MTKGQIVEFKRGGFIATILGGLLKLIDHSWDAWGWHLGILWSKSFDGWYVFEAQKDGSQLGFYSTEYLRENTRRYTWLENIDSEKLDIFYQENKGKRYDVAVYAHTMIQYLLLRFVEWLQKIFIPWHTFTISLPRILNDRWTCWELAFAFCREMNKPIQENVGLPATRYPMITDAIRAFRKLDK